MKEYEIVRVSDRPELLEQMAAWFHEKWKIPYEAYEESMTAAVRLKMIVPQWYVMLDGDNIIAGLGVIENDFHDRVDLTPNVCAVYTEESYRCQGLAGKLLQYVCDDMKEAGVDTLYLVTSHTSFYERYGWEFYCLAKEENGNDTRLYIHRG